MIGLEIIQYSLKNLWNRKMRSFLTIFSILVGIVTIFIFFSFGLGLFNYVNDLTTSSSADKVIIQPKGTGAPGLDATFALTEEEVDIVSKTLGVEEATGSAFKVAQIKQKKVVKYAFIISYDPDIPIIMDISNVGIEKGRMLKKGDTSKVLLGYNYQFKDKIFPKAYTVGENINIQGQDLKVVGFMESVGNPPDDSNIYTLEETLETLYPNENIGFGWVIARVDVNNLDETVTRIEKKLRQHRNLDEGKEDFFVQSFNDLIESFSGALNIIIGFVVFIAFISVIVSAINTANTMITSVLERIKEIGVMKAIGAKNSEIFSIFLLESFILGFIAGVLGVIFGWLFTSAAGAILNGLGWGFLSPSYSGATALISSFLSFLGINGLPSFSGSFFANDLFVYCIVFASITGALSGAFPAYRASKTNVVDALRYE
ncbi:ABC transporter permease [Candidatus Pacearchaeota archaeon]|nr:ABC transporter permease [Candidatus Pacearchaeota archaeon]